MCKALSWNQARYFKRYFKGNQLVSYTRQMDLVRMGDQAKFENASLRTKHFTR